LSNFAQFVFFKLFKLIILSRIFSTYSYVDFIDVNELEFVYNCPANLKFTQQISENSNATLSPVLNTEMSQFDKLTITAGEIGLIILKGELL
jgi:hypothetical protein